MSSIIITFPDGKQKSFDKGVTASEIVKSIGEGLLRAATFVELDGIPADLSAPVLFDCKLVVRTFADDEGKNVYRHTAAHILAQAVSRLYPDAKLAIGPSIKDGFYYDIEFAGEFTSDDLPKVEEEMEQIIKENLPITRSEMTRKDAFAFFSKRGDTYKAEMLSELEVPTVSLYTQGEYIDLCRGPHLLSTGRIAAFKLTGVAGAYWRGNVKNKMLTRIYGTAFDKKSDLADHLTRLEEAKRRDHRKLGRELELFDIFDEGPGFPFFFPKGMILRNLLEDFWRKEHKKRNYSEIKTPIILSEELWHSSGHWDHYKNNMYFVKIDEQDYAVKPMNCPGGMLVFRNKSHSYRDLPERVAELGLVHRHELSGALHGLMRVRCFTQDDAHIYMTPEQVIDEITDVAEFIDSVYNAFGFHYHIELSTRPEDSMGTEEQWNMATDALRLALERLGKPYKINEGDGAFYGPKIDFHLEDCIGRTWQCGTIQLDFQMPERFDLTYVGADGEKHRPVMIHRVILGSIERFIGILTEHFAGAFPMWLAPVQVRVLPISETFTAYASEVNRQLLAAGLRSELDERNEKIGYKIREAQLAKIPFMLVVGEKEQTSGLVAVRARSGGDLGAMALGDFIKKCAELVENKTI